MLKVHFLKVSYILYVKQIEVMVLHRFGYFIDT